MIYKIINIKWNILGRFLSFYWRGIEETSDWQRKTGVWRGTLEKKLAIASEENGWIVRGKKIEGRRI